MRNRKMLLLLSIIGALLLASCAGGQEAALASPTNPPEEVSSQRPLPEKEESPEEAPPPEKEPETAIPAAEPSFSIDLTSAAQGGLILLRVQNLPEGTLPTATTTLDFTPTFYADGEGGARAMLPVRSRTAVGSYQVTVSAAGAQQSFALSVTDAGFHVEYIEMEQTIADSTLNNSAAADEFEALYQRMKSGVDAVYWEGEFIRPVQQETPKVSSDYGDTRYVNGQLSGRHGGIDFPAPLGTQVSATNSGRVAFAGYMQQTGYTVCIEHGMGLKSWYFHMNSVSCTTGDRVEKGQKIGEVGTTGASTGYHLHFALSVGGVYLNPWTILSDGVTLE